MIVLFVAAGLAPSMTALGIVLWAKFIRGDPFAGMMAGALVRGFAAGTLLGIGVGVGMIALVMVVRHLSGR